MNMKYDMSIGKHRPVYLWAGPGTIRMNHLKFMGAPVDETVHREAHAVKGARRISSEAGFTWAYLTYDWGFPPEVEQEDHESFREAVKIYHTEGVHIFGYIQTSNCVYDGSYRTKDWYARDSRGRLIYYYTGRYMTCWLHPDWLDHLREMVRGVIDSSAEGVFFDNPWHAGQPLHFMGTWIGSAGCYCRRCREVFYADTGFQIPVSLNPESEEVSRRYLCWRADLVTRTIGELSNYARSLKEDVMVSANDFDAIMRPSYLIYGIDLQGLANVQDVLMIEDYGLPRWQPENDLLVNNALTLRSALALSGSTPLTTDPYDKGIGFDGVYPARRFQQGIAEAAACGVPMVVKGTEFVENGSFTLLTAERFAPHRRAIGKLHRWLDDHAALYTERKNLAEIGLLLPGKSLWFDWNRLAPQFFGAGQALIAEGLPWKVVYEQEQLDGLKTLLAFGSLPDHMNPPSSIRIVNVPAIPGWGLPSRSLLQRLPKLRPFVSTAIEEFHRTYFHSRLARRVMDRLGLAHFFLQSPYYRIPAETKRRRLVDALGIQSWPRVRSSSPLLIEKWRQDRLIQIHLVNYDVKLQTVHLDFDRIVRGSILTPDDGENCFEGASAEVTLDVYAIAVYDEC